MGWSDEAVAAAAAVADGLRDVAVPPSAARFDLEPIAPNSSTIAVDLEPKGSKLVQVYVAEMK